MAKKIIAIVELRIPIGRATPAPPVGTALGPHGVNIMQFIKEFNAKAQDRQGLIIPVALTIYQDRSFTLITKTPPTAVLIKKALKLNKASGEPNRTKVGRLARAQIKEITELKMPDLNATNLESAMNIVAGTTRSMGTEVE